MLPPEIRDHLSSISARLLTLSSIAPSTQKSYAKALSQFLLWSESSGTPFPSSFDGLDRLLTDYFHHQYLLLPTRGNRQQCLNLHSAISFILPWAQSHLLLSSRALRGWDRLQSPSHRNPLPHEVLLCLVDCCLAQGRLDLATFFAISFYGMLRISELLNTHRRDFSIVRDMVSLRLPITKTGRDQSVTMKEPIVLSLLTRFLSTSAQSHPFAHLSPASVRTNLQRLLTQDLGINFHFTPHSFRHGGATYYFISDVPLADIAIRGRWASLRTVRRYVQAGRSILIATNIPSALRVKAERVLTKFGKVGMMV